MKKYGLLSEIRRRRRWQQIGQQLHRYQNLLNRNFQAEAPNRKWVTDISYIQTKQGVLYLSMIRDLYDNSIVAYKTAAQQTVNLVLDTIPNQNRSGAADATPAKSRFSTLGAFLYCPHNLDRFKGQSSISAQAGFYLGL